MLVAPKKTLTTPKSRPAAAGPWPWMSWNSIESPNRPPKKQEAGERQRVPVDDPGEAGCVGVQGLADAGKGDVAGGDVEQRHAQPEAAGDEGESGVGMRPAHGGSSGVIRMDAWAAPTVASSAHADHAILHGMADWDAVRFFLELARAKTLARAARRLRVDYTTVGRRVSAFERELGAKLFERTPDGFVLTDAGESIRAAAEQMEQSAVDVEQRALGADRRLSGTVRVAATESVGHSVVLPAMRALHLRHPEIRLHLMTGLARLDIARREADLARRSAPPESGDLRIRRLTSMGFALYASGDYLARHRPPAPGAGFAGHDAVLFDEGFRGAPAFASLTDSLRDARAAVRANSMLSLVEAVANGLGVGALTCCLGDADPRLRRVFPDLPVQRVDLWLVVHADVQRTGRIRALIAALEARCRKAAAVLRG